MSAEADIKWQVREFYESIGWQRIGEGVYQNARYEDLRPVSREYIHCCHLRVARHLLREGTYLLDAGSGPIQYPEYLDYSKGYQYRVCLDIAHLALVEARERVGGHGLFVMGDIANLPFRPSVFEGLVSLHTVQHVPLLEQQQAFMELYRVLRPRGRAVVVNSWGEHSSWMRLARPFIALAFTMIRFYRRFRWWKVDSDSFVAEAPDTGTERLLQPSGSYIHRFNYTWLRKHLSALSGLEVRVWRSVSTSFLRALIHRRLGGKSWLRMIYWLEERAPCFFGRVGQYPMILFYKPMREEDAGEGRE